MNTHTAHLVFAGLASTCAVAVAAAPPADGTAATIEAVEAVFQKFCIRCHGPEKVKGRIALHALKRDFTGTADAESWARVLKAVEKGRMPPDDEPQPGAAERDSVVRWLRAGLDRQRLRSSGADAGRPGGTERAPTTRRMTNFEYQNTMRDLLGFELKLADRLPKDPVKPYHFNNTAELLLFGPEQLELLLECARSAMAAAIVDQEKPPVVRARQEWKSARPDKGLAPNEIGVYGGTGRSAAGGLGVKGFPRNGEFRIRFQASAKLPPDVAEIPLQLLMGYNLNVNSSTLRVEAVGTARLTNPPEKPTVFEFRGRIENFPAEHRRDRAGKPLPPSLHITPLNLYDDGTLNDGNNFQKTRNIVLPIAAVDWIEFEAPVTETWPPAHHKRILFDSPLRESDPDAYVREVLRRFMTRAYRRPAAEDEVARFAKVFATLRPAFDTFEATMRETLSLVLVTPQFLYHTVGDAARGEFRQYELASRLSYFLWGSMPDEELLATVSEGRLARPEVLAGQVRRLLADRRSTDFVRNFTVQWLSLEKMRTVPINRDLFPRFLYYVPLGERAGTEEPYRPTVRDFLIDESVEFVAELIRTNAPVTDLVHSDFAMLNQRLAAHYGVPGVQGDRIRRVQVKPEHHIGGLLTQGSVLIGNGTGTAPHPVYRAVWLREAILGEDVAPPPADVPALADSVGASAEKAVSIKDLLARHRQQESCRDCHARLDPWGIPFEQYNAIGRYQPVVPKNGVRVSPLNPATHKDVAGYEAYMKSVFTVPVAADSKLPGGPVVDGMDELKAYLLRERREDVATNVVRRLMSYGLGRELTWRDRAAVDEVVANSKAGGWRMRDIIVAICLSPVFQGR